MEFMTRENGGFHVAPCSGQHDLLLFIVVPSDFEASERALE